MRLQLASQLQIGMDVYLVNTIQGCIKSFSIRGIEKCLYVNSVRVIYDIGKYDYFIATDYGIRYLDNRKPTHNKHRCFTTERGAKCYLTQSVILRMLKTTIVLKYQKHIHTSFNKEVNMQLGDFYFRGIELSNGVAQLVVLSNSVRKAWPSTVSFDNSTWHFICESALDQQEGVNFSGKALYGLKEFVLEPIEVLEVTKESNRGNTKRKMEPQTVPLNFFSVKQHPTISLKHVMLVDVICTSYVRNREVPLSYSFNVVFVTGDHIGFDFSSKQSASICRNKLLASLS